MLGPIFEGCVKGGGQGFNNTLSTSSTLTESNKTRWTVLYKTSSLITSAYLALGNGGKRRMWRMFITNLQFLDLIVVYLLHEMGIVVMIRGRHRAAFIAYSQRWKAAIPCQKYHYFCQNNEILLTSWLGFSKCHFTARFANKLMELSLNSVGGPVIVKYIRVAFN